MLAIYKLLFVFLFKIEAYSLISVIYVFLTLLVLLLVLIETLIIYNNRTDSNKKAWQFVIADLIHQAVFREEDEENVGMTDKTRRLLRKKDFRNCLINELLKAKINLSGASMQNLKILYETLHLDKDSFRKLNNRKGHIKAKGIQELAIMEQVLYTKKIFRLTNSSNELVRNEAQCAMIVFYGFLGLRFLNVTAFPISQWQQIQLLNKLNRVGATNFDPLKKWLQSSNESVIIFSLKLAAYYNCTNLHTDVINCLQKPSLPVKLKALEYIKKVPAENSADSIISQYFLCDKIYKLAVLDALKEMGSEKEIPFVQAQLRNTDNEIKAAAAKCLSFLHPSGSAILQTYLFADEQPWKAIFLQIKTERAV